MTIAAAVEWEVRANGNASNGGGFTNGASGTDHTQQDSAFSTRTDLVIGSAGNEDELSSAADNFAADDVGNLIHITVGSGFTLEFFEVLSVAAGVATVDRNVGTADSTAGTGQLGGAITLLDAPLEAGTAGNTYHLKSDATHTLTTAINVVKDGAVNAFFKIRGFNITRGDNPTGSDRPLIAAGANQFRFDDFWDIQNLEVTTTETQGLRADTSGRYINIKSENSSGTAGRASLFSAGGSFRTLNCEAISTNGDALDINGANSVEIGCYLHDSDIGLAISTGDEHFIGGCIFDTCSTSGIDWGAGSIRHNVVGCTFFNNGVGLRSNNAVNSCIINCIFDANTTGVSFTTGEDTNFLDYNCWDNTTDVTNATKGEHAVNGDPGLVDPANGDFTLGSGSNCIDTGLQVGTNEGAVGDYKVNIGADQDDVVAGGGGGLLVHPGTGGGARG